MVYTCPLKVEVGTIVAAYALHVQDEMPGRSTFIRPHPHHDLLGYRLRISAIVISLEGGVARWMDYSESDHDQG